jgi:squalene-associated FAD-dependent desaturase
MASPKPDHSLQRVAIIGGGLSGLAAAAALAGVGLEVELFESRRQLGGRAASFYDDNAGEWIDHCQHVSMGCCTNLANFFERTGASELFRRDEQLYWIAPAGSTHIMRASRSLPAPLHLASGLWQLKFLSIGERIAIGRALLALARTPATPVPPAATIADWLARRKQSPAAIAGFWQPILVSALAETLCRISYAAARKVFIDAFMANRAGYVIEVPTVSLTELYDVHVGAWLAGRGVTIHRQSQVRSARIENERATALVMADGVERTFDHLILAVPWHQVAAIVAQDSTSLNSVVAQSAALESSPITAVHLWFDRPITDLPHAVLPFRMSQWIFRRAAVGDSCYYQVVISGSRTLAGEERQNIVSNVCEELTDIWPAARDAALVKSRVVTDRHAVFSPLPKHEVSRPAATTPVANLFLAGDWTATGWPATMEGAVRSGYLAAEALLASLGQPTQILIPDLPRQWLARWLIWNEKGK